jgi:hypothetical protein
MRFRDRFARGTHNLAININTPINTSAVVILGSYTTLWGFWMANPFWTVFTRAPLYRWMDAIMPEWAWGTLALAVGLAMVYGVIRHSYRSLITGALVGYFHWLLISIMYFAGDWRNTGGITALVISVYCGFVFSNIKRNRHSLGL